MVTIEGLNGASSNWFAVQVRATRELVCATQLRLRGYEIFLPCCQQCRRWSDRVKKVERALFPGYLFCRVSGEVAASIITTPGVIRIVGERDRPLPVPAGEIDALQRLVGSGLAIEACDFLEVGQRVRIEVGPLRNTEGIVVKAKNRRRLIVSITLLRRSVAVEVDAEWVTVPSFLGQRTATM